MVPAASAQPKVCSAELYRLHWCRLQPYVMQYQQEQCTALPSTGFFTVNNWQLKADSCAEGLALKLELSLPKTDHPGHSS